MVPPERGRGFDANLSAVLAPALVHLPEGPLPDELDHMVVLHAHLPLVAQNPSRNPRLGQKK